MTKEEQLNPEQSEHIQAMVEKHNTP